MLKIHYGHATSYFKDLSSGKTYIQDMENIIHSYQVSISCEHIKYPDRISFLMSPDAQKTEFDRLEQRENQKHRLETSIKDMLPINPVGEV